MIFASSTGVFYASLWRMCGWALVFGVESYPGWLIDFDDNLNKDTFHLMNISILDVKLVMRNCGSTYKVQIE
jgi:hypothetical protein